MTEDHARQNAADEMARAAEALAEARHLLAGRFFNGAMTRAYYAAFHGARGLLVSKGIETQTHRGVIQMLHLHFVKSGRIPDATATILAQLETYRELSDYDAGADFTEAEALGTLAKAETFLAACRSLLSSPAP